VCHTRCPVLVELVPELSFTAIEAERGVGLLVEAEATEKECCICLKAEEVGKLLAIVTCRHRRVCADC
jgi:hypothetical protein